MTGSDQHSSPKGTLVNSQQANEQTIDNDHQDRFSTDTSTFEGTNVSQRTSASGMETEIAKPAAVWEARDYSDLEVVVQAPPTWDSNDKMPVLLDTSEKIAHMDNRSLLSPSLADPVPAYPASLSSNRASSMSNVPLTKGGDYTEYTQQDLESLRSEKKVLGMNNRQLSFVAAGLLGFILVLLATVLAITLSMQMGGSHSDSTSSTSSDVKGILTSSKLAAVNWTDSTGLDRSAVFYQDHYNSILVSLRDAVSNEWSVTNVSAAVMNSTGAKKLDILPGTPLTAVTNTYQVSLYYLTTQNDVSEIWASDIVGGVWYAGSLASSLGPRALNGSKLSSFWEICQNCTYTLNVVFQETDGNLRIANFTDNVWALTDPITTSASDTVNGTSMSIRPFTENNATGEFGTAPNAWRVYNFDSKGISELKYGPETNSSWESDVTTNKLSSTVTSDPSSEIAAITYGSHGLTSSLVNYLSPNGSIGSYHYNGSTWTSGQPSLTKGSMSAKNFTSIATAQNMRVYGISNGSIYEYAVDTTDPFSWTSASTVYSS